MLDAHREGDIFFHLCRPTFRGHISNSRDLSNQVVLLYTLIERFGPNQVVGVPAFGNPLDNLSFERAFLPEMLHSCLSLPYILRFILIHKVPESSLPPRHTLPQVISGGWEQHSYRDWWTVFPHYRESSSFHPVPKEQTTFGLFLYNGGPYSQRPLQDHHVQPEVRQEHHQEWGGH